MEVGVNLGRACRVERERERARATLGHYQACKCKLKAQLSLTKIDVRVMKSQENRFVKC